MNNYIATHKTGGWIMRTTAETIDQAREQVSKMLLTPIDQWTIIETPVDADLLNDDLIRLAEVWENRADNRKHLIEKIAEQFDCAKIDDNSPTWQKKIETLLGDAGYLEK